MPESTDDAPLAPPTVEAAVWAEAALASSRALRQALARLTVDHRRELTPWQATELSAARRHADSARAVLGLLVQQLRAATAPPPPVLGAGVYLHLLPCEPQADPDPGAWSAALLAEAPAPPEAPEPTPEQTEAAEARADLDYDAWRNR